MPEYSFPDPRCRSVSERTAHLPRTADVSAWWLNAYMEQCSPESACVLVLVKHCGDDLVAYLTVDIAGCHLALPGTIDIYTHRDHRGKGHMRDLFSRMMSMRRIHVAVQSLSDEGRTFLMALLDRGPEDGGISPDDVLGGNYTCSSMGLHHYRLDCDCTRLREASRP